MVWATVSAQAALPVLAANSGSDKVGHIRADTGAVARSVQAVLRDEMSVRCFGTVGDGVADDQPAIQAALAAAKLAGIGRVVGHPGDVYRIDTAEFNYLASGVTENVGLEMQDGIIFDGRGCKFIRAGVAGDIVTNQFWFFGNLVSAATLSDFGVINCTFENDGVVNIYVSGVNFFAGTAAKAAGWIKRPIAENLTGIETRVLVKTNDDDNAQTGGKIFDGRYHNLHGVNIGASVLAMQTDVGADAWNISADTADFDIVDLFKGSAINIGRVRGRNVSEYAVNIENQATTGQIVEDVTVSDVVADGDGVRVTVSGSSTGILRKITMSGLVVPTLAIQQAASGTVENIRADAILHNSPSRALLISNAEDVEVNVDIKTPTLDGVLVLNSKECVVNGLIDLTGDVVNNCIELDRAAGFRGDIRCKGGADGLFLIGLNGTMGGANVHLVASGQNDKAVDWDGTASASHRVRVWGDYDGQATAYGNVEGSVIELQEREGVALTIATDELAAVFARVHVVNAQTGTTDNLQDINSGIRGQVVTLFAQIGDTLTVKHATGGGNIRTKAAADVTLTGTVPISLRFNGAQWCEL